MATLVWRQRLAPQNKKVVLEQNAQNLSDTITTQVFGIKSKPSCRVIVKNGKYRYTPSEDYVRMRRQFDKTGRINPNRWYFDNYIKG